MKKFLSLTITLFIMLQMAICCNLVYATDGAPKVVSITPSGEGLTEVSTIVVTFDKAMYSGRLTPSYIVLRNKSDNNAVVSCNEYWAYDTQYVAVYELSPDTTYELEVSASVESAAATVAERVQMGEQYLHTFSTGKTLSNITELTPKNDESYIHNYTTGTNNICNVSYLYDRDFATLLRVNGGTADQKEYSFITVDLGVAKKLAYVKVMTGDSDAISKYIHLQVSNDINFADENTVELAVTPSTATNSSTWGAAPSDDVAYKYIRIYRDSNISASDDAHCRIKEIYVYGYETAEESDVIESVTSPVQISKTDEFTVNSYELRGSLALGGEVTFTSDITVNGDYVMPKLYAAVYTETEAGAKQIAVVNVSAEGEGTVTITVPEDAENATAKFFIMTEEQNPLIACVEKDIH